MRLVKNIARPSATTTSIIFIPKNKTKIILKPTISDWSDDGDYSMKAFACTPIAEDARYREDK